LYGARLLLALGAVGQMPTLDRLARDKGWIKLQEGDVARTTQVGAWVSQRRKTLSVFREHAAPSPGYRHCFEAERYLHPLEAFQAQTGGRDRKVLGRSPDLRNHLRAEAGVTEAKSWEDYWQRARPILRKYWDGKGG